MDQYDEQFLRAMIQLGLCDENYANQVLQEQKQFVVRGHFLSIPQLLLQLNLATPKHIRKVEELLRSQDSAVFQSSQTCPTSSSASPIKSTSLPLSSKIQKRWASTTGTGDSRFAKCPECGRKALAFVARCPYCKAILNSDGAPYQSNSVPLVFYVIFGVGMVVLIVLGILVVSGVRFSGGSPINNSSQLSKAKEKNEIPKASIFPPNSSIFVKQEKISHNKFPQKDSTKTSSEKKVSTDSSQKTSKKKQENRSFFAMNLYKKGVICFKNNKFKEAIGFYHKSIKIFRELGDQNGIAGCFYNLGMVWQFCGKYYQALSNYKRAFKIVQKLGMKYRMAFCSNNIGQIYFKLEKYSQALVYYQRALEISKKLGKQEEFAYWMRNVGTAYHFLGRYKWALDYYKRSLNIFQKLGRKDCIFTCLIGIGLICQDLGRVSQAIDRYKQAMKIAQELGNKANIVICMQNIGTVYQKWGKYKRALGYYKRVLEIERKGSRTSGIGICLTSIGSVYQDRGENWQSLSYYKQALSISRKLKRKDRTRALLSCIGRVYQNLGKYNKALQSYQEAIKIIEGLRLNIQGKTEVLRRDYLAQRLGIYENLASLYIVTKKIKQAAMTMEGISSPYLCEKLQEKERMRKKNFLFPIQTFQKKLSSRQAVVYLYQGKSKNFQYLIDRENIFGFGLHEQNFQGFSIHASKGHSVFRKTRGLKIDFKKSLLKPKDPKKQQGILFRKTLSTYHSIIQNPRMSTKEKTIFQNLSRAFYKFLFGPLEKRIQNKTELLIIPSGLLAYLPIETLIMPDGRYMVEKYKISYIQSLGILNLIDQRRKKYPQNRKPLLLFGGATYEKLPPPKRTIVSEKELRYVKIKTWEALSKNPDLFLRNTYHSMNYYGWEPLPATALEIRDIQKIVPGSRIFSGSQASESRIKQLSRSGVLKQYRILHFATHGVALPEFPELSALVLSQFRKPGKEDGYLRMGEIARLKLQADFVNLSACETGLGKIYGGEGVVGLTQAFLIAGANGLSVSLWQVADESTRIFMVEFYRLVFQKKMAYRDAMIEVKRKFIRGDFGEKYKAPFFWAPFVYYGR